MDCAGNDLQHAEQHTVIFSSGYGSAGSLFITDKNLEQTSILFAVRRLIIPTWLNDRDQFLKPTKPLPDEFKTDGLYGCYLIVATELRVQTIFAYAL